MIGNEVANLALEIIPSVVANALTAFLPKLGRSIGVLKEHNVRHAIQNEPLLTILQKATAAVARGEALFEPQIEALKQFLVSPELDTIVKQLYATKLVSSGQPHLENVRKEFSVSLGMHLKLSDKDLKTLSSALFDAILSACDQALDASVARNNLTASEAKASLRHNVLFEELELIRRNLEFLSARRNLDINEINAFESRYRQMVDQRHGSITIAGRLGAQRITLENLYVPNSFLPFSKKYEGYTLHVGAGYSADRLIGLLDRSVVLGNPGAGKSTFAQYVCHTLITRYEERPIQSRALTPVLVVLKDYGAEKKSRNCSVVQFIESTANSKYQLRPPEGAVEYLLLNGRALVIFDGLDELLDTSYRKEITADVESFCTLYPATAVLVTSREVGYEQAPLDERFNVYRITEFDDSQIKSYVTKRFAIDEELTPQQRKGMARSFLDESRSISDLRRNPLLLGLMCDIYRGETYLPRNRPSIYEKCALMLFEKWDRSRQIDVRITFEDKLGPLLKYLAHWIYSDVNLRAGVTEARLIDKATEYLHERYSEDIDAARRTARDFIEFCRGRAWVFTDMGSTADGDLLYQFTHPTFLEYFTAAHLVRIHPTPDSLGERLLPHIDRREWDIVAQLAFQLQNANVEGAADKLISMLLSKSVGQAVDVAEWARISFATRALEFLNPTPRTARQVARRALENCLAEGSAAYTKLEQYNIQPMIGYPGRPELVGALVATTVENRPMVVDVVQAFLGEVLASGTTAARAAAFDVGRHLSRPLYSDLSERGGASSEYWETLSSAFLQNNSERIRQLASTSAFVARLGFISSIVTAAEITAWHGIQELFVPTPSLVFSVRYKPIVDLLLKPSIVAERKRSIKDLDAIATIVIAKTPPWVNRRNLGNLSRMRFPQSHKIAGREGLRGNSIFTVFVLFAILLESAANRSRDLKDALRFVAATKNQQLAAIRLFLLARYGPGEVRVEDALGKAGFTNDQLELVKSWIAGQTFFVKPRAKAVRGGLYIEVPASKS